MANSSTAAAVLASLLLCLTAPSWAQSSPEQGSVTPARAWFERGLALSESQRWLEAREAFRRSVDLEPHVSTYFNLAIVLLKVGEGRASLEALDAFELLADADEHAEFVVQAASLREQALALTGTLKLALMPPEARLRVDGVELAEPTGAIRRLRLDQGSHTLEVSAPARVATSRVVRVERGEALELNVVLEPAHVAAIESAARADAAPVAARQRAEPARAEDGRRRKKVWLWAGLSLVAAGAAAAAIGVAVARRAGPEEASYTGSTGIVFGQD